MKRDYLIKIFQIIPAILWVSVLFSNSGPYNGWILMDVLPVVGVIVIVLAVLLRKWTFILWGLALIASFFITMFLGYLFIGP